MTSLFLRSFIFWAINCILIVIYSSAVALTWVLPLQYRHRVIRQYLRICMYLLKVLCHIDYHVEGKENIPVSSVGVVLSKHQSTWETFFLPLIFHDPAVILKRELYWVPFFGWGLAASDPISINRKDKSSAMQQIIRKGKKCLDAGRWILVYPEGTRVPVGTVGHYKLGGARLAVGTGYPVIPIAHNAGRYWPRRKFMKRPGTIQVVIGPPIETKNRTAEEVLQLAKDWIEGTMCRIDTPTTVKHLIDKSPR